MFNYSSPSVKNSALLALASIPHKLAGSLIFGIWCRAVLLFLPSSVGLLALPRSRVIHTGVHTRVQSQWCTVSVSFVRQPAPLCCWGFAHNVFATGFKVFSKSTTAAISSWRLQHAFHSRLRKTTQLFSLDRFTDWSWECQIAEIAKLCISITQQLIVGREDVNQPCLQQVFPEKSIIAGQISSKHLAELNT